MKKNKLILTSGILMLIGSLVCMIVVALSIFYCVEYVQLLIEAGVFGALVTNPQIDDLFHIMGLSLIALSIIIYLASAVTFIILGIKLIIKTSKKIPLNNYKGLAITTQVLAYVCAGFSMGSDMEVQSLVFAIMLTSAILLSVALFRNKKENELLQSELNADNVENTEVASQQYNVAKQEGVEESDKLMRQIKSLQELKDSGVLSNDDYVKLIHKVLGLDALEVKSDTKTSSRRKLSKGDKDEG